jgi:hypothetical protein
MKSSSTILASALLCGAVVMPTTIACAQQPSLKDQLIGTWTPVSWERVVSNGDKMHPYRTNPRGVVMFDADGRVFVMFAHPALPRIVSNNKTTATPKETQAVMARSIAYFGTYSASDADNVISLRLEASTFPNQLAQDQKRTITRLTADELKYEAVALNGDHISVGLKRAAASTVGRSPSADKLEAELSPSADELEAEL